MTRQRLLDELQSGGWEFQTVGPDEFRNYRLQRGALELIAELVHAGDCTLETGVGYSTIAFALAGAHHTAVSPFGTEHDRVRSWCNERGVPLDHVTFLTGSSQDVLPALGDEQLDLVLIDGDHAFPIPFIDFYYTARRLRTGGVLIVDDTHIKTGEILRDFLRTERGRWRLLHEYNTAVVFERLAGDLLDPSGWLTQPYCARTRRLGLGWAELLARARDRVRLRSRIRAVLGRS